MTQITEQKQSREFYPTTAPINFDGILDQVLCPDCKQAPVPDDEVSIKEILGRVLNRTYYHQCCIPAELVFTCTNKDCVRSGKPFAMKLETVINVKEVY
jgi:hypothetical protein